MSILAAPFSLDPYILSTSYAAATVGSVLGVGILALGYIAKLAGAISRIVDLDSARSTASLTKLIQERAPVEAQTRVEQRIQVLNRQLDMLLARAQLLRRILMLVHVGWMFLFFAGLFAFMQPWHNPLWIGSLVCVVISMCAVLLFVCGALYETYIMMDVDYSEEAYVDSLPTKPQDHED